MVRNYVKNAVLVNVALICVAGHGAEPTDLIARLKKLDGKSSKAGKEKRTIITTVKVR